MNRGTYGTAFVEYRPNPRLAINLMVDNAIDTHAARDRTLFIPNRAAPATILDEFRDRDRHPSFMVTLKQSFGGASGKRVASKGK